MTTADQRRTDQGLRNIRTNDASVELLRSGLRQDQRQGLSRAISGRVLAIGAPSRTARGVELSVRSVGITHQVGNLRELSWCSVHGSVPIENTNLEFAISLVWSRTTPPVVLPALLEAADAMIAENGWD